MRRICFVAALGAAAGCAALGSTDRAPQPEAQLEAGLAALELGEYDRARRHLSWVYTTHWAEPAGQQALLALIAADLDPRNPDRRLGDAADLAARLIVNPDAPEWAEPLAESLYLLALQMGAHDPPLDSLAADSLAADSAPPMPLVGDTASSAARAMLLPTLDAPSFPRQLATVRTERDSLAARIGQLQEALAQRDRAIREKDAELERIRKIIKGG